MAVLRRLAVALVAISAVGAAFSGKALAAGCPELPTASTVQSAHFIVGYDPDSTKPDYATQMQAQDVAAFAEQAYTTYSALGFPAPRVDGSGKTEIVIDDLSALKLVGIWCSGNAAIDAKDIGQADEGFQIGALVFAESMESTWNGGGASDQWLFEGAASWASWHALRLPGSSTADLGPTDVSLDCSGITACVAGDGYASMGQSRWPFYEFLTQRFGTTFVTTILQQAALAGSALGGLQAALNPKGGLGDAFGDYTVREMTGGWGNATLDSATFIPKPAGKFIAGIATGDLGSQTVSVPHLAARYVEFDRGDGQGASPCFNATLTITVTMPSGITSRPFFYWPGSPAVALSVANGQATTTVPWDTCTWKQHGLLSLPNASTSTDAAWFTVSAHVAVNPLSPATPAAPPSPVSMSGTVVPAPTTDVAPQIDVFGPELIRVSASDRLIRLIVQSSGPGVLNAALGAVSLGSGSLRGGNNDLRFTIPKSLLGALRRSASASNVLTLTPASSSGAAAGTPVTRVVSIAPAKPKPKKKP